jgi:predicted TIM-barrel fold metal-dependent hydrolase
MERGIIDCECHAAAGKLADLLPYMHEGWQERFTRTAFALPNGNVHPGEGRLDKPVAGPREVAEVLPDGVTAAILVPHQVMAVANWTDTKLCSVYASALNRYFLDHWLPADPRFRFALAISPHEPDLAAAEIREHGRKPGVVAIAMPLLAVHFGHRHYRPILEAAAEFGLPVIVHPGGKEGTITGTPALGGIGPRHAGEYHALIWQVAGVNISSLIYDGVFVELPELKVVFAGFGFEWAPPVLWRINAEWRALRIDIPWVTEPPAFYMARNIRLVASSVGAAPVPMIRHLANLLPEPVLLYGSNHPFSAGSGQEMLDAMSDKLRPRVAHLNAAATFNIG